MAVCISHQKIMSFFGSLKQIWLLSSTNLEFFRFTHTAYFVHLKNSRFVDSRSQILISFTEKTQDFLFEMQTAIIAHQWKSKFSQCTANPAGLQRKTDRKMEKPIALRARSFFPWAKLLVLNFVERKNHFLCSKISPFWFFYFKCVAISHPLNPGATPWYFASISLYKWIN